MRVCFPSPVTVYTMCFCARLLLCPFLFFLLHVYISVSLCVCLSLALCVCVCMCVGQGSKHAAVCRPAVPVNGGAADDAAAADGGGPEVAGAGGKAAGNTHSEHSRNYTHKHTLYIVHGTHKEACSIKKNKQMVVYCHISATLQSRKCSRPRYLGKVAPQALCDVVHVTVCYHDP